MRLKIDVDSLVTLKLCPPTFGWREFSGDGLNPLHLARCREYWSPSSFRVPLGTSEKSRHLRSGTLGNRIDRPISLWPLPAKPRYPSPLFFSAGRHSLRPFPSHHLEPPEREFRFADDSGGPRSSFRVAESHLSLDLVRPFWWSHGLAHRTIRNESHRGQFRRLWIPCLPSRLRLLPSVTCHHSGIACNSTFLWREPLGNLSDGLRPERRHQLGRTPWRGCWRIFDSP